MKGLSSIAKILAISFLLSLGLQVSNTEAAVNDPIVGIWHNSNGSIQITVLRTSTGTFRGTFHGVSGCNSYPSDHGPVWTIDHANGNTYSGQAMSVIGRSDLICWPEKLVGASWKRTRATLILTQSNGVTTQWTNVYEAQAISDTIRAITDNFRSINTQSSLLASCKKGCVSTAEGLLATTQFAYTQVARLTPTVLTATPQAEAKSAIKMWIQAAQAIVQYYSSTNAATRKTAYSKYSASLKSVNLFIGRMNTALKAM